MHTFLSFFFSIALPCSAVGISPNDLAQLELLALQNGVPLNGGPAALKVVEAPPATDPSKKLDTSLQEVRAGAFTLPNPCLHTAHPENLTHRRTSAFPPSKLHPLPPLAAY